MVGSEQLGNTRINMLNSNRCTHPETVYDHYAERCALSLEVNTNKLNLRACRQHRMVHPPRLGSGVLKSIEEDYSEPESGVLKSSEANSSSSEGTVTHYTAKDNSQKSLVLLGDI